MKNLELLLIGIQLLTMVLTLPYVFKVTKKDSKTLAYVVLFLMLIFEVVIIAVWCWITHSMPDYAKVFFAVISVVLLRAPFGSAKIFDQYNKRVGLN